MDEFYTNNQEMSKENICTMLKGHWMLLRINDAKKLKDQNN